MSSRWKQLLERRAVVLLLTLGAVILFGWTRIFIFFHYPYFMFDVPVYYGPFVYGGVMRLNAYIHFPYYYPPLTLPFLYVAGFVNTNFYMFWKVFRMEMLAVDIACFILLSRFLSLRLQTTPIEKFFALSLYSLLGLSVGDIIYDRFDILVTFYVLLMVYLFTGTRNQRIASYVVCCLGGLTKFVPIFFVPLFMVFEFYASPAPFRERIKRAARPILFGAVPLVMTLLIYNVITNGNLFAQMGIHSDRGIQVQSTWANPFWVGTLLTGKVPYAVEFSYGAHHLVDATVPPSYLWASKYSGFIGMLCFYVYLFLKMGKLRISTDFIDPKYINLFVYSLLFFVVASQRVLSNQYFIWLLPGTAILFCILKYKPFLYLGFSLLFYLTFKELHWYGLLLEVFLPAIKLLTIRNILLIGISGYLMTASIFFYKRRWLL